ncbi:hypothetical protein Bbelb_337150 [Branchiostoma belcheri]|nr:hypothetical protein Bbelb_402290 [Branchiostoma belcheri]KAI8488686.1 hypothetical protein Bbelb_337150 [Branchiostoma belcheri]
MDPYVNPGGLRQLPAQPSLSQSQGSEKYPAKEPVILFVAHCSPMYCVQLWNNHSAGVLQKLRVAYHDAFKIIMSQPRSTSNGLFFAIAQLGVDTFDARRRKLTHSFAARLLTSGNGIISLLLRFDAFPRSQFWRRYCQLVSRP